MQVNRRRFLFGSAAIVAASSLMPGHSIAHIIQPDPRGIILRNVARIERELMWANAIGRDINQAVTSPCFDAILNAGNLYLPTPSKETVAELFTKEARYKDYKDAPDDALPVAAAKVVLGRYKCPVQVKDLNHWSAFVDKYADTLPDM